MYRDALAFPEQLDPADGDVRFYLPADQAMRHRVVMSIDVDMVIGRDPSNAPTYSQGSAGSGFTAARSRSRNRLRRRSRGGASAAR